MNLQFCILPLKTILHSHHYDIAVHAELCEIFDAVGVDEEKMSEI